MGSNGLGVFHSPVRGVIWVETATGVFHSPVRDVIWVATATVFSTAPSGA
jgi:hypothetical protein